MINKVNSLFCKFGLTDIVFSYSLVPELDSTLTLEIYWQSSIQLLQCIAHIPDTLYPDKINTDGMIMQYFVH